MAKQPSKGAKTPGKSQKKPKSSGSADESANVLALVDPIPPEFHRTDETTEYLEEPVVLSKEDGTTEAEASKATDQVEDHSPQVAETPPPFNATAPQSRGGILPLFLGGVLAAAIGFGVAYVNQPQMDAGLSEAVQAQSAQITELRQQLAGLPPVDLSGLETAQSALLSDIASLRADFSDRLDGLDARIADLESLPRGEGSISDRAIAAYESDLEELRAQIADMRDSTTIQLEAARAEAAAIEENAAAAARNAAGRAALARIMSSLESGAPLGAALADLEASIGGPAPDALLAVQDGVPTLAELQERFPDVARAALATARREGVAGEETTGFGAFLRNQFDVRSVAPREGTEADAVLSRAEAAVKSGRLADGLAEIAALPEVARAEMSDWLALAEARADAVAAVDILSTSLNEN